MGEAIKEAEGPPNHPRARTEVVCQSPVFCNLFTTTVEIRDIPQDAVEDELPEDVLRETQEINNSVEMMNIPNTQEQCNADCRAYEEELRKANKHGESIKKGRSNRTHSEESSSEEGSEKKNRKIKRSRSNCNLRSKSSTSAKKTVR